VTVEGSVGLLTISAVHIQLRHTVKQERLEDCIIPLDGGSMQEGTIMQSIPPGAPDTFHLKDANYSKLYKATI
jgi:hypothetical protein